MKTTVLLLCLLCSVFALRAQTPVLVLDSTYTSFDDVNYQFSTGDNYYYNTHCKDSVVDQFFASYNSHNMLENEYYANGLLYRTYINGGNDSVGNVNSTRETYTYTAANAVSTIITDQWSTSSSVWMHYVETANVYDANGFLTSDSGDVWDQYNNKWLANSYDAYYNDSKGVKDSAISGYLQSDLYSKITFTYTPLGRLQQQIINFYATGSLQEVTRITYTHDSTNYVSVDSVITEAASGFNPTNFRLDNTIITQSTFNTDGTVKTVKVKTSFYFGVASQDSYSISYFHYAVCTPSVLPVILLNFGATQRDNNALLQWQTANETNASYFTVQRSTDGLHFTPIGKVVASGNSAAQKSYSYTDANINNLAAAKVYYRLAVTDLDGKTVNSAVAEINIATGKLFVSISPNPVQNTITIHSAVNLPNALVRITDMTGHQLYASRQTIPAGEGLLVNASHFAKGMYLVTVQNESMKQVIRIMK